ncbi:MAG: hypothetical protein RMN51_11000 [Verrucomicrobiota bacterium]|nr:hypothetical protein [Verrucomicrobiota bacterium]
MSVGRHIVELSATNNGLIRTYVWGLICPARWMALVVWVGCCG